MEFQLDSSLTGLLIAFGLVLGLYGAYFFVIRLSNRSTRRLKQRGYDAEGQDQGVLGNEPAHALPARWVIPILLATLGGLAAMLALITHVSR